MSTTVSKRAAPASRRPVSPTAPLRVAVGEDAAEKHILNLREMPAWLVSLVVHLAILFVLGSLTRLTRPDQDLLLTSVLEELDPDTYEFDTAITDRLGSDGPLTHLAESTSAAQYVGDTPQREIERKLNEEFLPLDAPPVQEIFEPNRADLVEPVDLVGESVDVGSVEGAIDRLTLEIAAKLQERKTLVIWIFDVSPSMHQRRNAIADRFENVYRQLGMLKVDAQRALKTAVVAFGDRVRLLTEEPVDDVAEIVTAIRQVEREPSGQFENVFTAVHTAARKWAVYRTQMRRNVMIIVVTDEAGTDQGMLEKALQATRPLGISVYVVGNAAPFGRKKVKVPFRMPSGEEVVGVMEQGPESILPERLHLPFWGTNGSDLERLSSGFGPYALTRLCAETGGLFFISEDTATRRFDRDRMRDYQPDYIPVPAYHEALRKNRAKAALVEAAKLTTIQSLPRPQLIFRADNENILRQQLTNAQRPLAELDYHLDHMLAILEQGLKDRPKLTEPRWRAGFDLARGRILAMRARSYGYNAICAAMKRNPKSFSKKDSNMWRLVPARIDPDNSDVRTRKMAAEATELLTRVLEEHPGTPWALLAERELSQPMGWAWREGKMDFPDMRRGNGNGNNNPNRRSRPRPARPKEVDI